MIFIAILIELLLQLVWETESLSLRRAPLTGYLPVPRSPAGYLGLPVASREPPGHPAAAAIQLLRAISYIRQPPATSLLMGSNAANAY